MPSFTQLEGVWGKLQARVDQERKTLVENPELKTFNVEEIDKNILLLAELYLFRFMQPDSALRQYSRLLDNYPESLYAPQALYNLAYIYGEIKSEPGMVDSAYSELIRRFPESSYANLGREQLGIPLVYTRDDSARSRFMMAESILLDDGDPGTAFSAYRSLSDSYAESIWAPKALYSMAWISETYWDSLDLALALYDELLERYPESTYAKDVQEKVAAVKNASSQDEKTAEASMDSMQTGSADPDSSEAPVALVSEYSERVARTRRRVLDEGRSADRDASLIDEIVDLRNRIRFPENIEREEIADVVFIEVEVDTLGAAGVIRIRQSSGNTVLDAACMEAVRQARFRPAIRNGNPQTSTLIVRLPLFQDVRENEEKEEPQR
jgi:TonB family protein